MRGRSQGLGLLLLIASGAASLSSLGCKGKDAEVTKKVVYRGPLVETNNVLTLISDSAKLQVRLTAPVEQQFESGDMVYPKGMVVMFYGKHGDSIINTLHGNYGNYNKNKNLYFVRGNVRVKNEQKQQQLNTEKLYYDKQKGLIYNDTSTFVRIQTATEVLTGKGLTANQDFSRYRILKPAGVFTVEPPAADSAAHTSRP